MKKDGILQLAGILSIFASTSIAVADLIPSMYWADSTQRRIQRADLDGSNITNVITTGLEDPRGIVLDQRGEGKIYWADRGTHKIERANLDGTGRETLVSGLGDPNHIALDLNAGKMYWTDSISNKIQRANLDGSGVEDIITTGLYDPYGIDLDLNTGHVHWADAIGAPRPSVIDRSLLNGTERENLITAGVTGPYDNYYDFILEPGTGEMYWTGNGNIWKANLDGSRIEQLVQMSGGGILGIAISGDKMYWSDALLNRIHRADLDGTDIEILMTTGANSRPQGIAVLVPEPMTFSLVALGAVGLISRKQSRHARGPRTLPSVLRFWRRKKSFLGRSSS